MINLSYGNGRTVRVPKGLSVLEASLRNNVPHASVCGGRARCSTCRIRIIGDHHDLPEPSQREAFVLSRVGTSDPSIRLACQLRPANDLSFFQLFLPHTMSADAPSSESDQDRPGALSRQHVRGHARLDQACGKAAALRHRLHRQSIPRRGVAGGDRSGGRPNQFVGDGMLALFGLAVSRREACRQALRAAAMIAVNVDEVNNFWSMTCTNRSASVSASMAAR